VGLMTHEPAEARKAPRRALTPALAALLRVLAAALCCWVLTMPASRAQNSGGFPGFLQSLFGQSSKPQETQSNAPLRTRAHRARSESRKKGQDFVSTTATRAPGSPGGAPVKATFFVSVLGDSLGILAAQGLVDAFADKPEISIADQARDLSGLTRDDYYDWPKAARDMIAAKTQIDLVVIMIGINDLQPLKDGGETLDPLSDKWRAIYGQRVENFLTPFRDAHIPVLWVGLPSMNDDHFNSQVIALNAIDREHAEKAGAKYVDIWDAFADQSGQYAAFGPDVDGQNSKLRSGPNGIYLTKAGSRKLAHFLEADIRKAFDKTRPQADIASLPPDIEQEADDINAQIRREMGAEKTEAAGQAPTPKPLAGPILSLTAQPASAHGELIEALGATTGARAGEQIRVLRVGEAPAPQPGRADDFTWTRTQ
jgi:hypothetical protein